MTPKKDLRKEPLWRLALRFAIIFIIVVVIIEAIWQLFSEGNLQVVSKSIENGQWVNYLITKLIVGTVYGFTMAYFTKKKATKK